MPTTWLTVAALAQRLGRAESTIRLWRDRYRPFVPERLDQSGHKLYPLERIEEIATMAAGRLTPREIASEMERLHGPTGDDATPREPDRLDRMMEDLRHLREQVDWLVEREKARGD